MKAELCFLVKLPWQQTLWEPLQKIAVYCHWEGKEGWWFFRLSDLKKVEALLGTIEIPLIRDKFDKEKVYIPEFKGDDFVEIREFPKIYQIVEHRKMEVFDEAWGATPKITVKEIKHDIPKELVKTIWDGIIVHMVKNRPVKTSTVAEKICNLLQISRFSRQTGSFDFAKFFGSRKEYYQFFYLPVKVLAYQGKIRHHKSGKIERII